MTYDPANNFDDTVNEIVLALHASMAIKGEPGAAWDDERRLTITLPHGELSTMLRAVMQEMGLPVNTLRPGQLPLDMNPGSAILTPDAIRNGKVK